MRLWRVPSSVACSSPRWPRWYLFPLLTGCCGAIPLRVASRTKEGSLPPESIGRFLRRAALGVAAVLSGAFLMVCAARWHADRALAGAAGVSEPPPVDVVRIDGARDGELRLPGE